MEVESGLSVLRFRITGLGQRLIILSSKINRIGIYILSGTVTNLRLLGLSSYIILLHNSRHPRVNSLLIRVGIVNVQRSRRIFIANVHKTMGVNIGIICS